MALVSASNSVSAEATLSMSLPSRTPEPTSRVPFGLRQDGRVYEPREVPVGKACGCICPGCGAPLLAVHAPSDKMIPHFKHQAESACTTGFELAVHRAVLQVLTDKNGIWVPPLRADIEIVDAMGVPHKTRELLLPGGQLPLANIRMEPWPDSPRPDILADAEFHGAMLIDVRSSKAMDSGKLAELRKQRLPVLELDVSCVRNVTLEELTSLLMTQSAQMCWRYHPLIADKEATFRKKVAPALAAAKERAAELQRQLQADHDQAVLQAQPAAPAVSEPPPPVTPQEAAEPAPETPPVEPPKSALEEKIDLLEKAYGAPRAKWPVWTQTPNKFAAALGEPYGLWQAALFHRFFLSTPDSVSRPVLVSWVTARFPRGDQTVPVESAVNYYLKVLLNRGVVTQDGWSFRAHPSVHRTSVSGAGAHTPPSKPATAPATVARARFIGWSGHKTDLLDLLRFGRSICDKEGYSFEQLHRLLGGAGDRLTRDHTSPRLAAEELTAKLGGNPERWLAFLISAGLAKDTSI